MPLSLHTDKIRNEKNAFIEELYNIIVDKDELINGNYSSAATKIHQYYLTVYIFNHFKRNNMNTAYYDYMLTSIIESEALVQCGFVNAALMQLRSSLEMAFKMLYYECHPIEWELHEKEQFDLRGVEYREFLYRHPKFSKLPYENKENIERVWGELCKYSHYDINVVKEISVISDIKTVFSNCKERDNFLSKLKLTMRIIVEIMFIVDNAWLVEVEKSYFDYVFEVLFKSDEIRHMKIALEIE
jgi:hypothetical protein